MAQQPMLNPFGPPSDLHYTDEYAGERDGSQDHGDDDGPVVAFISGIGASVDDEWIKKIFEACCNIVMWKRAYDSDERPQSFGFCEFKTAKDAVRAIRVLSSTRGLHTGGWVLPGISNGAEAKPLDIIVDVSVRGGLEAQLSMLESQDDADNYKDTLSALDAVKSIFKELEESISAKEKDSEIAKPEKKGSQQQDEDPAKRKAGDGLDEFASGVCGHDGDARNSKREAAEQMADPEAGDAKVPVSLEDEEAWEKEKLQKSRYRHYIVAAEEREHRMAKEQADREEKLERSAMRELDR
ncbi:hypothetical protein GGI22_007036, partial [Coemansia erecta]